MLALALAAVVANEPLAEVVAVRQAVAVVRIVRPARIPLGRPMTKVEDGTVRTASIREADGSSRTVSLVEYY